MVIGLDPGTKATGYAVVRDHKTIPDGLELVEAGVWKLNDKKSIEERCFELAEKSYKLVSTNEAKIVGVESPFAGRNIRTTIQLSRAGGAIYAGCSRAGASVIGITAPQAKRAVLCSHRAKKYEVIAAVKSIYGLTLPDDAADAVAVATAAACS